MPAARAWGAKAARHAANPACSAASAALGALGVLGAMLAAGGVGAAAGRWIEGGADAQPAAAIAAVIFVPI